MTKSKKSEQTIQTVSAKPYTKPKILLVERLEAVADICTNGKKFGDGGACESIIGS